MSPHVRSGPAGIFRRTLPGYPAEGFVVHCTASPLAHTTILEFLGLVTAERPLGRHSDGSARANKAVRTVESRGARIPIP